MICIIRSLIGIDNVEPWQEMGQMVTLSYLECRTCMHAHGPIIKQVPVPSDIARGGQVPM